MKINKSPSQKEHAKLATQIQRVKKGYLWVRSLWQERTRGDYCLGSTAHFVGGMTDRRSQQLKWVIWQNDPRLTQFR